LWRTTCDRTILYAGGLFAVGALFSGGIMRVVVSLLVGCLLISTGEAHAQTALPKEATCPSGFYTSGKYCVPIKDDAKPAMLRGGQCPSGYYSSGKYCVAQRKDAPPAVPKNGPCPNGYYTSGAYCLQQKR
jgi:hypothetical protein